MARVKQEMLDERTGRPYGDHGTGVQAITYALDHVDGPGEGMDFLRAWNEGDLEEYPEFYEWLAEQEPQG